MSCIPNDGVRDTNALFVFIWDTAMRRNNPKGQTIGHPDVFVLQLEPTTVYQAFCHLKLALMYTNFYPSLVDRNDGLH